MRHCPNAQRAYAAAFTAWSDAMRENWAVPTANAIALRANAEAAGRAARDCLAGWENWLGFNWLNPPERRLLVTLRNLYP